LNTKSVVKFGIVGCGNHANTGHLPDLSRNTNAKLVATCDLIVERARLTKELWHAKEYYTDYNTMLERSDIDAVIIASSMTSHGPLAIKAARAGKHFFVQKPMATNMRDANIVVEEARKAKVKAQVRPDTPLIPHYKKAREIITKGTIGRPLWFQSCLNAGRGPDWGADTFLSKDAGPLYDVGVYSVSPITFILGPAKKVVGLATTSIPKRFVLSDDEFTKHLAESVHEGHYLRWSRNDIAHDREVKMEVEDNTFTLLDMGDGCLGSIISNFIMPCRRPFSSPDIEIYGEEGGLTIGNAEPASISIFTNKKGSKYQTRDWYHLNLQEVAKKEMSEMDHFVDCILNDKEPLPSIEWGRHVSEIMIKSLESSRLGKSLKIETTF
jgi:predicted dehydrogenase